MWLFVFLLAKLSTETIIRHHHYHQAEITILYLVLTGLAGLAGLYLAVSGNFKVRDSTEQTGSFLVGNDFSLCSANSQS